MVKRHSIFKIISTPTMILLTWHHLLQRWVILASLMQPQLFVATISVHVSPTTLTAFSIRITNITPFKILIISPRTFKILLLRWTQYGHPQKEDEERDGSDKTHVQGKWVNHNCSTEAPSRPSTIGIFLTRASKRSRTSFEPLTVA